MSMALCNARTKEASELNIKETKKDKNRVLAASRDLPLIVLNNS
jgi:hypothetical protein